MADLDTITSTGGTARSTGQDVAFVIDTTGSMFDDIAAVKASATSIIDAIFDPDRGLLDSRIAIVGYNDPTTRVILPFTDEANPEDRKDAAQDAIDSIRVFGGGDFPELVYTGLERALDGDAGEWRGDPVARKIVLFGDASAKDGALESRVLELAANVNAPGEPVLPVQIFTVALGSAPSTQALFSDLADATAGTAFTAADASEIVDTLLEVIGLPIYTISVSDPVLIEGDAGVTEVTFTISRDVADRASSVTIARSGSADDDDATPAPATVEFGRGETAVSFTLDIRGDGALELDETLSLRISSVTEPAAFAGTATVTIRDDDGGREGSLVPGTDGSDYLQGTDGTDVLRGLGGDDRIEGRGGEDVIDGGDGLDQVRYTRVEGGVGIDLPQGRTNGAAEGDGYVSVESFRLTEEDDFFIGRGAVEVRGRGGDDKLYGRDGDDLLIGGSGNDVLSGGGDDDRLVGGLGCDVLVGNSGDDVLSGGEEADLFVFGFRFGTDRITDFEAGVDTLVVEASTGALSIEDLLLTSVGRSTTVAIDANRDGIADTDALVIVRGVEVEELTGDSFAFVESAVI